MEVDINDLVNYAIEQGLIPVELAEAINRELVAAYVKGAAHRDDDHRPYDSPPYGFHRFAAPTLDVTQAIFNAVQFTMEEDPLWNESPCFELIGRMEIALFYEAKDAAARIDRDPKIRSQFRTMTHDGSTLH